MEYWNGKLTIYYVNQKETRERKKKGQIAVPKKISDKYAETVDVEVYMSTNSDVSNHLKRDAILFKLFDFALKEKRQNIIKFMQSKLTSGEIDFLKEMNK
jgi:hypothetical protein